MPGDVVLVKADTFQGKRKIKDWWSDVEYIVVHQVVGDMPAYEVCDEGRNLKVVHQNSLFLVATLQSHATPLDGIKFLSSDNAVRSALVELTPLECDCKAPE